MILCILITRVFIVYRVTGFNNLNEKDIVQLILGNFSNDNPFPSNYKIIISIHKKLTVILYVMLVVNFFILFIDSLNN